MAPNKWIHTHIDFGWKMLGKDKMHYNSMCTHTHTPYMIHDMISRKKTRLMVDYFMIITNKMSAIANVRSTSQIPHFEWKLNVFNFLEQREMRHSIRNAFKWVVFFFVFRYTYAAIYFIFITHTCTKIWLLPIRSPVQGKKKSQNKKSIAFWSLLISV